MRKWTLISGAQDPTGDGLVYAQNVSERTDGEINRRKGMTMVTALGPKLIAPNFYPGQGYMAILFTSSGTIESVAL